MTAILKGKNVDVHVWAPLHEVESAALDQLRNVAALPWVFHHVAAMADVHLGKGATVGSVVATRGALCPAMVGVDIGCGMAALRTSLKAYQLPDNVAPLRTVIEAAVPVGFHAHDTPVEPAWFDARLGRQAVEMWEHFKDLDPAVQDRLGRARSQLGTLGGGNHFIEISVDDGVCHHLSGGYSGDGHEGCRFCGGTGKVEPHVWIVLHSGSRNIGKELAEVHMGRARGLAHNAALPDPDLAAFLAGTPEMAAYRHDLFWAQDYARLNRMVMLTLVGGPLGVLLPGMTIEDAIYCHHNYVAEEYHYGEDVFVTRKGAIRARLGDRGIIPGSMGTSTYIVTGIGNAEAFHSASHGAGRRMSRGAAKRRFTLADLEAQTAGVECRKDEGVLDEIPGAYKDIDTVMAAQKDLVRVDARLRAVLCVKG